MKGLLDTDVLVVRERVSYVKLTDTFDLLDAATGRELGVAQETPPAWAKWLRLVLAKNLMPNAAEVRAPESEGGGLLFSLRKGAGLFRHRVEVLDAYGRLVGTLKSKVLTLGGGFFVHDPQGALIAEVQGDWIGWNFLLKDPSGRELGKLAKKWSGLGREFLTSADNYVVELSPGSGSPERRMLLVAAALSIDFLYKEAK